MRRLLAAAWVVVLLITLGTWVTWRAAPATWRTDVAELLPADERDPEATQMRQFLQEREARVVWLALMPGPAWEEEAATHLEQRLSSPPFRQGGRLTLEATARAVGERRWTLLFPRWLEERWGDDPAGPDPLALATAAVAETDALLAGPTGLAWAQALEEDPLLLGAAALDLASGLVGEPTGDWQVWWAELDGSPMAEGAGAEVDEALGGWADGAQARGELEAWQTTGVWKFAAASQRRIRAEVGRLNLWSALGVALVTGLALRRPWRVLGLAPVPIAAMLAGVAAVDLWFGSLHVILLVLGALLIGISIDYGFHISLGAPAEEKPEAGLARRIGLAAGSSVIGFAVLLLAPLPLLRQLGVLVGVGLVVAVAVSLLLRVVLRPRETWFRPGLVDGALSSKIARRLRWALLALALVAALGLVRISWQDDLRELNLPDERVLAEERAWRQTMGDTEAGEWVLTTGPTLLEALGRQAEVRVRAADGGMAPLDGAARVLPTPAALARVREWVSAHGDAFPVAVAAALEHAGYETSVAASFRDRWAQERASLGDPEVADRHLAEVVAQLPLPYASWLGRRPSGDAVVAARLPAGQVWSDVAERPAHTRALQPLGTLNTLFSRYREQMVHLLLIGGALVAAGLALVQGPRAAARLLLPVVVIVFAVLGALGWRGAPLNLFHAIGLLLGVCLAIDFGVFSPAGRPPPASVRLAALTSLAAFGALATSSIPAVAALGLTVAGVVGLALLELETRRRAEGGS